MHYFPLIGIILCLIVFERASNYLVEGLGALSHHFNISEAVMGASIAAMGSSAPEFGSSAFSVLENHPTIGLGTIVGSAIFNITIIIGGSALVGKCLIEKRVLHRDGLFYLLTVIVAVLGIYDGQLSRIEAIFWALLFIGYLVWLIQDAKKGKPVPHEHFGLISPRKSLFFVVVSLLAIGIAARYLVIFAADVSTELGVSQATLSLIVLAAGTSVPDMFTSLQAARKGMGSLAVSNALGSNIFDILAGVGIPFSFRTVTDIKSDIELSIIALLASVGIVLAIIRYGWSISRKEGALLLGVYGTYLALILLF